MDEDGERCATNSTMNEILAVETRTPKAQTPAFDGEPRSCFVIMPFSPTTKVHTEKYWTDFHNKLLQPADAHIRANVAGVFRTIRGCRHPRS